jgi:predicted nucleic acid-binding protein
MKTNKYLLDTNIWVAFLNKEKMILDRLAGQDLRSKVCMSVISQGELIFGAFKSRHWMENVENVNDLIHNVPIVYINDDDIAFTYGLVKSNLKEQGITLTENDLWIASTAIHYRLTLVTRDRDFDRIKGFQLNIESW